MRKVVLCVCVLTLALLGFGCSGPKMTDEEKNAPPPPGPHGNSAGQPANATGGPGAPVGAPTGTPTGGAGR